MHDTQNKKYADDIHRLRNSTRYAILQNNYTNDIYWLWTLTQYDKLRSK